MTDSYNGPELFQLKNGRYIDSDEISVRMFRIKAIAPEKPQTDNTGYSWDESGMADLFGQCYHDSVRYCKERKSWYTYSGGAWEKDTDGLLVSGKIREFARLMTLYCGEIADNDIRDKFMRFVASMGDRRFRERMMKDARDDLQIPASELDAHPNLINCLNGTFDLDRMEFREHDWRDFLTMRAAVSFAGDMPPCPRWVKFIDEVTMGDRDKADYLQRALGYSILGTSREECMFIVHGKTTRNGKSTMLGTVEHLLGDYASVSPVSIICRSELSKNAEAASPTIAALKGRRFVTMSESDQYGRLDEEAIKQLTGGEEITARNLYEAPFSFLPQFTMWLSCNDLPSVRDRSLFASDRVRVIEFDRHFTAEERDETLKDAFREPDAMSGIFAWLVDGCAKYRDRGLTMPEEMKKVIRAYEKDNDVILQFLEDVCEKAGGVAVRAKDLYDTFKLWAKSNGYYVLSARKFYAGIEAHPEWHNGRRLRDGYPYFIDIRIKTAG